MAVFKLSLEGVIMPFLVDSELGGGSNMSNRFQGVIAAVLSFSCLLNIRRSPLIRNLFDSCLNKN